MQITMTYIRPNISTPFWVASTECKQLMAKINMGQQYIKSVERNISPDWLALDIIITYNSEEDFNAHDAEFNQNAGDFATMRHIYNITHQHNMRIAYYTDTDTPIVIIDTVLGIYNYETKN